MEKHMIMCINTSNGEQKPFPKLDTEKPYFVTTGFRPMTTEEEALYVSNAQLNAEEPLKNNDPVRPSPEAMVKFKKFIDKQSDIDLLESSKVKFPDAEHTAYIDAKIVELKNKVTV